MFSIGLFFVFVLDTYRLDSWHAWLSVLVPNTYLYSTLKFIMRYLVFLYIKSSLNGRHKITS